MRTLKVRALRTACAATGSEVQNAFRARRHRLTWLVLALLALLVLAFSWRWTPLADWLELGRAVEILRQVGQSVGATLAVAVIALASACAVPVTFLAVVSILAFGPIWGSAYLLLGSMVGGVASFLIGKNLGRDVVEHIAGQRIARLDQLLARHGPLPVITLRMVPIAPFAIVNMAVGVTSLRLRDFVLGTILGMMPGTALIAIFIDRFAGLTK